MLRNRKITIGENFDRSAVASSSLSVVLILPPWRYGLEQVDDLDARLEHLQLGGLLLRASARGGESASAAFDCTGRSGKSTGSPSTFSTRPSVSGPTGTEIGAPVSMTVMPRCRPSVALHGDGADAVLAEVLFDLGDEVSFSTPPVPSTTMRTAL